MNPEDGEESQTFLVVTSDGGQLPTFRTLTRADSICATSQQSPAQSTKSSSDSEQEWQNISVRDDKKPNPSLEAEHADERRNPQSLPAGTGMRTQHDSKWRFEIPKVQAHVTEVILTSLERTFTDLFPAAADTNGSHEPGRRASYLEIFIATGRIYCFLLMQLKSLYWMIGEISLDDRGDRALLKASQIMIHHSVQVLYQMFCLVGV